MSHVFLRRTRPRTLSFVYFQKLSTVLGFLVPFQNEAHYLYSSPLLLFARAIGFCVVTV